MTGRKKLDDQTKKDTVIIIPAFNEEKSIGKVLNAIPRERVIQIVVVDNNSTDKTKIMAQKHGALVIKEKSKGYGSACLKGISQAKTFSPKYVAFLDGDFSDSPQDLRKLLNMADQGHDLVIGSRTLGEAESGALLPQAMFGNWLSTRLMKIFWNQSPFSDLGPFRIIRLNALEFLSMEDKTFGWTVEMQAKALMYGLKNTEVSVNYKKRIGVSKITGTLKGTIFAGYKILFTLFKLKVQDILKEKKYEPIRKYSSIH
jgi:glycosyltransferase involved in cell wall biosynthesis